MKKTAVIIFLAMSCILFAGCSLSDSDNSGGSDNSASTAKKAEDKMLAVDLTKQIKNGEYSLTSVSKTDDSTADITTVAKRSGKNYYNKMVYPAQTIEMYYIDGTTYVLDSTSKTYYTSKGSEDEQAADPAVLPEGYKYDGSEISDGLICETYIIPDFYAGSDVIENESSDASSQESADMIMKYYFDEKTEVLKKLDIGSADNMISYEIKDIQTNNVKIELPNDFDKWTKMELDKNGLNDEEDTEPSEEYSAE